MATKLLPSAEIRASKKTISADSITSIGKNSSNIEKLSSTNFRFLVGPYNNLNSLKKSFNAINVLEFDSIEIIKK